MPITDCSAGALYWAYDDTVTTGEVFVPEPWMTQYISSMYYPNRAETGAVMRMRLDPLDMTLESMHTGHDKKIVFDRILIVNYPFHIAMIDLVRAQFEMKLVTESITHRCKICASKA